MIRVHVLYPAREGARFDFDYYLGRHMTMVKARLVSFGVAGITVHRGVASLAPGVPAPYVCITTLDFPSTDSVQQALAAHGAEILGDTPNFTNVEPVMQFSAIAMQENAPAVSGATR